MVARFANSCCEPPLPLVSGVAARSCIDVSRYCGACVVTLY
jgi:hypothetical protein